MNHTITEHNLFKPAKSKSENKAEVTDRTARSIIEAEAERREAKTTRLRRARLEQAQKLSTGQTVIKPRRAKPGAPRRAKSSK